MAENRWMKSLMKVDGAMTERHNVHNMVIETHSPSVNACFGRGWGLPLGYTLVLYGPPKGGKSLLVNSMIGSMHKAYEDGWCVKFDTEFRDDAQLGTEEMKAWGIDPNRYQTIQTNTPDGVFDTIEKKLGAMCQDGFPLKLVVIDSINSIQGRRQMNNDSVLNLTIGDKALTLQEGLQRILAVQRKYKFALVLVSQIRAEMDQTLVQRGQKVKMAAGLGLQHHAEYFLYVEKNETKAGRTGLDGKEFVNDQITDMNDRAERVGHKIRTCMKDSSLGPKGRFGEFTLIYDKGIVNQHEEIFTLGVNRGVIEKPNQVTYSFNGRTWRGQQATVDAIKNEPDLYNDILRELKRRDNSGGLPLTAEEAAASQEESA
jgi:hypothetical protein